MIRYSTGDLLESNTMALVNAVNCQGVMGKGIAYQFKKKFPKNFSYYKAACENNQLKIGDILTVAEYDRLIINFPTKDSWRLKSQYEFIEKGLNALRKEIIEKKISSISIPPLGCGNGGLDWLNVERMIIDTLGDLYSVEIVLFPPARNEKDFNEINLINIKHLLAYYAFNNLKDKKRYSLNTLFYMCQKISGYDFFNFTIRDGRAYSDDLDKVTEDIKYFKQRYGEDLDSVIDDFINTHLTRDMEREFKKIAPNLISNINFFNTFESKDEFSEIPYLLDCLLFGNKHIDPNDVNYDKNKKSVVNKMLDNGIIRENIFGQYELIY
ncbi:macro domain-containing protein [Pectobacterium odoriferum]|uniref:macro domain-containing protein n=2 Tax=Pectobacterium odoriferum TaxID=78398 RepID=UPI0029906DC8|nr:macro domain-containing protein [Pectobacterium odoriferum]